MLSVFLGPRPLGKSYSFPPREVPREDGQRVLAAGQEGALRPVRFRQESLSWRVLGQGHTSYILCHPRQAHQVLQILYFRTVLMYLKVYGSSESSGTKSKKFYRDIDSHPGCISCEYGADKEHLKTVTELYCLMKNNSINH